mmetsp:Transcript_84623/g.141087  ORF Transcript_84623/g.141087 Transcript_84623/m.141087 type:complete len:210 (-) Transcript_84623:88-717(-)
MPAATVEINPSTKTAAPESVDCTIAPAMAAISNPPSPASAAFTASASPGCTTSSWEQGGTPRRRHSTARSAATASAFTCSPVDTTCALWATPASSRPVPRPTASAGAHCCRAQTSADDAVVFPMPSSPIMTAAVVGSAAFASAHRAASLPTFSAWSHWAAVMAGPLQKFCVPFATLCRCTATSGSQGTSCSNGAMSPSIPTSTTSRPTP